MIRYIAVILLDAQQPPAKYAVVYMKPLHEVEIQEHAETRP